MYKEIMTSIDSIEIYPIISLAIFFSFFVFLLYQVWRMDKSLMNELSGIPLSQDHPEKDSRLAIGTKENITEI